MKAWVWIRIRIRVKSRIQIRIRIRIKQKNQYPDPHQGDSRIRIRIRIRIKMMRINNTVYDKYDKKWLRYPYEATAPLKNAHFQDTFDQTKMMRVQLSIN